MNYKQSEQVKENTSFLAVSSQVVRQTYQLQKNIWYMERGLRGYMMTGDKYLLQSYDSAYRENEAILTELKQMIPPGTDQYKKLSEVSDLYTNWVDKYAEPLKDSVAYADESNNVLYTRLRKMLNKEEDLSEEIQREFRIFLNYEYKNRQVRREILDDSEQNTKRLSILLTASSIVIGFLIAILLARHISRRIVTMTKMADKIAAGNYNATVNDTRADELSKLSFSLNEMAKTLSDNFSLLENRNKELNQFAYVVSHDLKAPLRGIVNIVAWIFEDHDTELTPKLREYLELIKGRANRLEALIEGILSYARTGTEKQPTEKIDVNRLVEEIIDNNELRPGLQFNLNNLPVMDTEKVPLTQVFGNLISNAIKYHDKQDGKIHIYGEEHYDHYKFIVSDDGPGIAPAYHKKIFVIFQTLNEKNSFESTGVGLAITKKILDDRGEDIQLISSPGNGSRFIFTWSKRNKNRNESNKHIVSGG